jgi:hypothetical protein
MEWGSNEGSPFGERRAEGLASTEVTGERIGGTKCVASRVPTSAAALQ